jgi:hypothetical protein
VNVSSAAPHREFPMRLHLASVVLLLALGCAGTPPPAVPPPVWAFASASPAAGKELRMRSGTRYIQVSIDGNSIFGPVWSLTHGGTFIRGFGAGKEAVQITLKGTHAEGNLLNAPLTVDLKPPDNGLTNVTGLFGGGTISNFNISPTIFQGKLGTCSYDLKFNGTRYEGMSSCAGDITPTSLDLPAAMASWTDLEVAVVLAIVIGS